MHALRTHQPLVKNTILCRLLFLHLSAHNPFKLLDSVCWLAAHSSQGKSHAG